MVDTSSSATANCVITYDVTYKDTGRTVFTEATIDDSGTPGEIDFLVSTEMTDYVFVRAFVTMLTGSLETIHSEEV